MSVAVGVISAFVLSICGMLWVFNFTPSAPARDRAAVAAVSAFTAIVVALGWSTALAVGGTLLAMTAVLRWLARREQTAHR